MDKAPQEQQQRRSDRLLGTALMVVTFGVATAGVLLFRTVPDDQRSADGSLIVNINNATEEELEPVPGIGPTRALQIIANRPYATVDELERVYGIVPQQVDEMRPYVKVEGETETFTD